MLDATIMPLRLALVRTHAGVPAGPLPRFVQSKTLMPPLTACRGGCRPAAWNPPGRCTRVSIGWSRPACRSWPGSRRTPRSTPRDLSRGSRTTGVGGLAFSRPSRCASGPSRNARYSSIRGCSLARVGDGAGGTRHPGHRYLMDQRDRPPAMVDKLRVELSPWPLARFCLRTPNS